MAYTQSERLCRVVSPLGEDALLLLQMTARESVSGLFSYECAFVSERDDLDFEQIVGKPLGVGVRRLDGVERWFHGLVARFEQGVSQGRFVSYRAEVVPWFWMLSRRAGCRIFQHLSVPDIAKKIFGELGFSDYKLELAGSYPELEYCVQYRESDLAFLSRLFEDVGIGYFFEHSEKAHTLVLFDSPDANAPCPDQEVAVHQAAQGEGPAGDVRGFRMERELRPGAYALADYNFEQPSLSLLSNTTSSSCVGSSAALEVYDHPGVYAQPPEGDARVKCRMEAEECASVRVDAESDCIAFTPGYRFDLRGHYRRDSNQPYLITEVTHFVTDTAGHDEHGTSSYENRFACIPHSIPFRPQRTTPRPFIRGVQTATVVGAAGKEIDVDEHARVIVQFHWDREGQRDEKSSCRIRVAQNWAGKGWGLIAHPRIGQEVIVEFLEGDPDRPIITGRVYNGEQIPPYAVPGNSTQSGLKSRSSPGGGAGNFNEIRFEDKTGEEQVYIQAEKDRSTLTKNDDSQSVGHDRSRSVGNDESVSIGANQKVDVAADRSRSVGGSESVSVTADETRSVGGSRSRTVSGTETLTVALARTRNVGINEMVNIGAAQEVTVGGGRMLNVGAAQMTNIGALHDVNVGGPQSVSVGSNQSVNVSGSQSVSVSKDRTLKVTGGLTESVGKDYAHKAGKNIVIDAGDQITIKTGSASITMKKNGDITISGKNINLKGSGNIVMKAKKILEN